MFASMAQMGAFQPPSDGKLRDIPPPTPIVFPSVTPQSDESPAARGKTPLVALLQSIHRPADIRPSHFEALGVHVIPNASAPDLIPDASYLPPVEEWNAVPQEDLSEANQATRRPLCNGNYSPGLITYRERRKELLIDNTAAFRTIRRIPAPAGEPGVRLGNAYEFYKCLEFFSGYWQDTSLPSPPEPSIEGHDEGNETAESVPGHLQTHMRTGTGSQLPPDYRQQLLTAFVKLVAYDFGCNVSFPRTEPRLHLAPPPPASPKAKQPPPSYFNSSATFIYRTPTERSEARAGILGGPVACLSARNSTVFSTVPEQQLDLAREVVAVLLTAQQRSRENKKEVRFGEGKWWTTVPRWGGGPGGPIGREGDKVSEFSDIVSSGPEKLPKGETAGVTEDAGESTVLSEVKRQLGGPAPAVAIASRPSPRPNKRSKLKGSSSSNMQIYDAYRKLHPPGPTWDRKTNYSAIGRVEGKPYDDVFLLGCLNHHVSIVRARVPDKLIAVLDGAPDDGGWDRLVFYRSQWFDLFRKEERVEAMGIVWGMMAWLMRRVEPSTDVAGERVEKMDLR